MFKKSLTILLLLTVHNLIGCTKNKEDLAPTNGQYFVKSLGENVDAADIINHVPFKNVIKVQGNYDHRNGSLYAKLSTVKQYRVNSSWNHDIKISSIPTFYQDSFILINDKGIINQIEKTHNSFKLAAQFFSTPNLCSNLSSEIKDNIIVASCGSNTLSAFDIISSDKLWSAELDMAVGSKPLITTDSNIIVFTKSDAVYSLNLKSGELLWFVPSINTVQNKNIAETKPILFNDRYIVQQTADDQVRLINLHNGVIEWISSISKTQEYVKGKDFVNAYGNIALDNEDMYLVNSNGFIVKIQIGASKANWMTPMIISKPVWLLNDRVLGINDMGMLFALSKSEGKILWSYKLNKKVVSTKKGLFQDGQTYDTISYSAPIVVDNQILILSSNNELFLINPENGQIIEKQTFRQNIFGQPVVHNGKVYVMINNGNAIIAL